MAKEIKNIAVLGSGVMGAGIAAHLAGCGKSVLLLDIIPKYTEADQKNGLKENSPAFRNKLANASLEGLQKARPSLVYSKRDLKKIKAGNFEDNWNDLKEVDMVIEVVVERLDIKQSVFAKLEATIKPGTIVASNTSGLPLADMSAGRSAEFKKNFLVTHFFNPVRYMNLVEIISSPETSAECVDAVSSFLEKDLGKGVVTAKDTPNFIANRIGTYSWVAAFKTMMEEGYSIEEVDAILGPATGKPKSAMFRTADLVGLDTLVHVIQNLYDNCPKDEMRGVFAPDDVLAKMVANGWLGDKTKGGFYKKAVDEKGEKQILALDLKTLQYRPKDKVRFDSTGAIRNLESAAEKIKTMVNFDDRGGQFAWKSTRDTLIYALNRLPEIADDIINTDNAMKWGFNWELGPFETIDAIGAKEVAEKIKADGLEVPAILRAVLEKGDGVFYKNDAYFDILENTYKSLPKKDNVLLLKPLKEQSKVIKSNASASIIDLDDGVLCLEFHSKMNAIDADIGLMGMEALELIKQDGYKGLVIANEAENFSVGANLMLIWLESQQKNWTNIEKLVKEFQDFCMAMRYSAKPVVAAPFGMTLGGGCEIAMGADKIRAAAETYIGLVEVGAGLIPGGGGNKNVLINVEAALQAKGEKVWMAKGDGGPFPKVQKAFQTIGFATVATSAKEGLENFYLKKGDSISLNKSTLIADAKQDVLDMSADYQAGEPREDILLPGEGGLNAIKSAIRGFISLGQISEHDALIAEKLGWVLTGGNMPNQGFVSEQYLLDIEREAFLSLCGEEKSQARMQSLLTTGKPLRN